LNSRQTRFVRVARRVAEALGQQDCLLAGGLAVMAHGFVRATRDVDLLTRLPLSEARARLSKDGLETRLLRGDVLDGGFSCLKGECDGLPFDVLPELVPIHWELAPTVEDEAAGGLRAVALEDLLALKLKAQGPKDLMDAAMLVLLHPESEPRARELATAYRALDRFEIWLKDPRIRAQAREEAELERRRAVSKPRSKTHAKRAAGPAGVARRTRARKPTKPR
jgi:hypothetical protein